MTESLFLSVVVPVYNKKDSLHACVDMLVAERAFGYEFEIVLVDDGSTDGSKEICRELFQVTPHVRLIEQVNQGVSAARNAGVQAAVGDYVLFVDADDELTPGSVDHLIAAARLYGEEVDLITYPIKYVNAENGHSHGHKRERFFNRGTGVYSLEECPHISQTTMNICVKREAALAHPFSVTLKMGEDQLFNTTIVVEKGAIGWCAEATYRYIQRGNNTSKTLANKPLYAFDQMIELYSSVVTLACMHEKSAMYCYELVLHNFWWRCQSGSLFPDFGGIEERARNYQRLEAIVFSIPNEAFYRSVYLTAAQKAYLLKRFSRLPEGLTVTYGKRKAAVKLDGETLWRANAPYLKLLRATATNTSLNIMAYVFCSAFGVDPDSPTLVMKCSGEESEVELHPSSYGISGARELTTRAWYFTIDIPLTGRTKSLSFHLKMGTRRAPISQILSAPMRANARIGVDKNTWYFASCNLKVVDPNKFIISSRAQVSTAREFLRDYRVGRKYAGMRRAIRRANAKAAERRVWLYVDLPSSCATGNALVQVLHDLAQDDGITRWYVSGCCEDVVARHPALAGRVVLHHSREHLLLFMQAEMILASYLDTPTFLPAPVNELSYLGDLEHPKTYVYLQHGILHAHMPTYFSYDRKVFDYEVISTEFERNNLMNRYYFPEKALICSGAPRLDLIGPADVFDKRIIYAPSWRSYLVGGNANSRKATPETFANSTFFQGMIDFLSAVNERGFLREFGYTLDLKLHPNFALYRDMLPTCYENIHILDEDVVESKYAIVITDYSSFVYDFYYAGAQVLYFLPDRREFEGGANHYSKLDFALEDGLGPLAESPDKAAEILRDMVFDIEKGGASTRMPSAVLGGKDFFFHKDCHNADRLYSALIGL